MRSIPAIRSQCSRTFARRCLEHSARRRRISRSCCLRAANSRAGLCAFNANRAFVRRVRSRVRRRSIARRSDSLARSSCCWASRRRPLSSRNNAFSETALSRARARSRKSRQHLPRPFSSSQTRRSRSRTSGTANSAAALGVGARRSATKSAIVKSTSWPTARPLGSRNGKSPGLRSLR